MIALDVDARKGFRRGKWPNPKSPASKRDAQ
jgi:hypothetical protein